MWVQAAFDGESCSARTHTQLSVSRVYFWVRYLNTSTNVLEHIFCPLFQEGIPLIEELRAFCTIRRIRAQRAGHSSSRDSRENSSWDRSMDDQHHSLFPFTVRLRGCYEERSSTHTHKVPRHESATISSMSHVGSINPNYDRLWLGIFLLGEWCDADPVRLETKILRRDLKELTRPEGWHDTALASEFYRYNDPAYGMLCLAIVRYHKDIGFCSKIFKIRHHPLIIRQSHLWWSWVAGR